MVKITPRPIFCISGICSLTTMGIGKTKRMISDRILATAVAIYRDG